MRWYPYLMLPWPIVDEVVDRALREDLSGGDLTTEACVRPDTRATAVALAKSSLVFCGGPVFARVFERIDPEVEVELLVPEGAFVASGAHVARVAGRARSLLVAERTALNLVQRMSGIATMARAFVGALPVGSRARVTDTRKTTPGLRPLERYAVRAGGAHNHRDDLGSAVLIKDNHIVASGGIREAVERARARAPHTSRVEVEVTSMEQLEIALAAGADVIMLDNFEDAALSAAVARVRLEPRRPLLEVSGGITLDRVRAIAETGIDVLSVGALTHSVGAADISLDLALAG